MNYTYKVVNTTIKDSTDLSKIVVSCSWYKQGENENGQVGKCYSNTQFNIDQVDPLVFVPFEDLTEEVVLSWIQNSLSETDNTYLNNCIEQDLNRSLYPEVTVTPPWEVFVPAVAETPVTEETPVVEETTQSTETTEQVSQGE